MLVLGGKRSGKTTVIKLMDIALHRDELERRRREARHVEEINEEPFSEERVCQVGVPKRPRGHQRVGSGYEKAFHPV